MPRKAPSVCSYPGCGLVSQSSRCAKHQVVRKQDQRRQHRAYNANRPESDKFYGTALWRKCRDAYIAEHPLCCNCKSHGLIVPAHVVDHIKPYKEYPELALDWDNLRSLCMTCHNSIGARVKAAKGEGGSQNLPLKSPRTYG